MMKMNIGLSQKNLLMSVQIFWRRTNAKHVSFNTLQTIVILLYTVTNFFWMFFTFLSCQYVPHNERGAIYECACGCYAVLFTVGFGSIVNIWPTVLILFDWIACPVRYFDVCFTLLSYNDTQPRADLHISYVLVSATNLGATNNPSNNISNINTADELKRFIEYEKVVLLFSAVSGTISYLFFIYCVLCRLYIRTKDDEPEVRQDELQAEPETHENEAPQLNTPETTSETSLDSTPGPTFGATPGLNAVVSADTTGATHGATTEPPVPVVPDPAATDNTNPLHPFDDTENGNNIVESTSTKLDHKERITFWLFLLLSLILLAAMCIVFIYHYITRQPLSQQQNSTHIIYRYNVTTIKGFEITTAAAYFYSLFCTISSCFIFSKVMYGIQNQCKGLLKGEKTISKFIEEDENFIKVAMKTQRPFEMWFFIHWVLYIITSFLSLSFLFEAINKKIQASLVTLPPDSGIAFHNIEFILITLLAASNSFFFLYPCIRAAGVTESRRRLIRKVNNHTNYLNLTDDKKRAFVTYLKEKNYGFRLNILCAHVKFNLNIAYISIFIGLLGVLIKVGSSI